MEALQAQAYLRSLAVLLQIAKAQAIALDLAQAQASGRTVEISASSDQIITNLSVIALLS